MGLELVPEPEAPKPKMDWRHLRALGSLPDNVYLLRPVIEPTEPPDIAA